jgi:hypothetical protein
VNANERALIHNVQTHDLAESYRLRRATRAREAGLPPEAFALPFPGNTVTTTTHTGGGMVRGALLAALLLAAGGGSTLALASWLNGARPSISAPAPPAPVAVAPDSKDYEIRLEEQQPDGSWKALGSERVRVGVDRKE